MREQDKTFKITIELILYAPESYTERLIATIKNWMRRTISHKKLKQMRISKENLSI